MSSGVDRIAAERARVLAWEEAGEGFSIERDVQLYKRGELTAAARCYIAAAGYAEALGRSMPAWARDQAAGWPWDEEWWKPSDDPIRCLEKAGQLIAAEIDRLDALVAAGAP